MVHKLYRANPRSSFRLIARFFVEIQRFICNRERRKIGYLDYMIHLVYILVYCRFVCINYILLSKVYFVKGSYKTLV